MSTPSSMLRLETSLALSAPWDLRCLPLERLETSRLANQDATWRLLERLRHLFGTHRRNDSITWRDISPYKGKAKQMLSGIRNADQFANVDNPILWCWWVKSTIVSSTKLNPNCDPKKNLSFFSFCISGVRRYQSALLRAIFISKQATLRIIWPSTFLLSQTFYSLRWIHLPRSSKTARTPLNPRVKTHTQWCDMFFKTKRHTLTSPPPGSLRREHYLPLLLLIVKVTSIITLPFLILLCSSIIAIFLVKQYLNSQASTFHWKNVKISVTVRKQMGSGCFTGNVPLRTCISLILMACDFNAKSI